MTDRERQFKTGMNDGGFCCDECGFYDARKQRDIIFQASLPAVTRPHPIQVSQLVGWAVLIFYIVLCLIGLLVGFFAS